MWGGGGGRERKHNDRVGEEVGWRNPFLKLGRFLKVNASNFCNYIKIIISTPF